MHGQTTEKKPKGLKQRGGIWWIDKIIRVGEQTIQLRESTRCRALSDATIVLNRRIEEVTRPLYVQAAPGERTFAEAAAEYVADLERRGKSSERQLYALELVMPEIENLPLKRIHQRTLQPWIDKQKGQRSSGTVGRTLQAVSTVLHYAATVLMGDEGEPWLKRVPPKLSAPDWGARKPRPISWDEQDRLVAALPAHLVAPVLFALATGARQAEVVSLRWDQHQRQRNLPEYAAWWIPPEIRKGSAKKAASQQSGRFLVCNRLARSVLERQRGLDDVWVFPSAVDDDNGKGRPMYRINNHGWRTACKTAGLKIRVHDLRHTFGSRAADAGIPLDVRRSLLGHEHRDITLHYSAPGLVRLLEEAERVVRPSSGLTIAHCAEISHNREVVRTITA